MATRLRPTNCACGGVATTHLVPSLTTCPTSLVNASAPAATVLALGNVAYVYTPDNEFADNAQLVPLLMY